MVHLPALIQICLSMQIILLNTMAQEGIMSTSKAHHHPRLRLQQIWALCPPLSLPAPP